MTAPAGSLDSPRSFPPAGSVLHLIGVGGAGMSAIARVMLSLGYRVQGSDLRESTVTTRLRGLGVRCSIGHEEHNVEGADAVVYSAAVKDSNPELKEARRRGIPIFKRSEALSFISTLKSTISVAGTHGKTSTASMLALVLSEAGFDPSFMVGGELNEAGTNAGWGEGEWLVLEADESDGTFLGLSTDIAVVTNVDRDHLENWGESFDLLKDGFFRFMKGASSAVVVNRSDPVSSELCERLLESSSSSHAEVASLPEIHYFGEGLPEGAGVDVRVLEVSERGTLGEFRTPGGEVISVRLPLIGRHFALNAAAVVAVSAKLGVDLDVVRRGLEAFEGVERRMVMRGEHNGVAVYDDYAHSPAEVEATLEAGRRLAEARGGRLLAVFQPHLYSRTFSYHAEFARALRGADAVFLTDVYPAREDPIPGVSGRLIADSIPSAQKSAPEVFYEPSRRRLIERLVSSSEPKDLVVVMGAGDITAAIPQIFDLLAAKSNKEQAPG